MNIILFDQPEIRTALKPFTFTRPTAGIRIGILTIAEKWQKHLEEEVSFLTADYLQEKFPLWVAEEANLIINGALCPNAALVQALEELPQGASLMSGEQLLAAVYSESQLANFDGVHPVEGSVEVPFDGEYNLVEEVWHIYTRNGKEIKEDFQLVTAGRKSQAITDPYTRIYAKENIFIEEGADIKDATLNAEAGPIYIGKDAVIQEGAIVRGPFALCEHGQVMLGAKMRGNTTVGPWSKLGGEVDTSVVFGYSNKGHDGYMGHSVLGEWCNLGADTNTSNLKNNYAPCKVWSFKKDGFVNTGEQFLGLIMGDHAKAGINTMFNTATVVGVGANVFGEGYPRNYIPSYSWGGHGGFSTFALPRVVEVAKRVMARRSLEFSEADFKILARVFEESKPHRVWEKK
ncbi:GlmU family protein [Persicobacter diffluens]|uniref:Glucose-1-phosphate thymidylyltransferase n=1 Tax=Persicobacter diffluens TaxID=981 RepID=A0AAN4VVP1_9BACT|nr:glucose-1-phosphate thymidylyltransferase [Persicobacter diffluens]